MLDVGIYLVCVEAEDNGHNRQKKSLPLRLTYFIGLMYLQRSLKSEQADQREPNKKPKRASMRVPKQNDEKCSSIQSRKKHEQKWMSVEPFLADDSKRSSHSHCD